MSKVNFSLEKPQRKLGLVGVIIYIVLMDMFIPLSTDLYLPAMPTMGEHLATSDALVQLSITIFFFSYAIGMLIGGPLSDKYGRKAPTAIGFIIFCVASLLCMLAVNIYMLLAARLLQGIGAASGTAISFAMVKDCFSGKARETVLALVQTFSGFAPIIAPVLGSWILLVTDWRGIFGVLLIFGLIGFGLTLLYDETLAEEERLQGSAFKSFRALGAVMHNKSFVWIVLIYSVLLIPYYAYINMSPYIYVTDFGLNEQVYSYYYAGCALFSMIGPFIYIRYLTDVDKNRMSYLGFGACIFAGVAIILVGNLAPIIFCFLMFVFNLAINILRPFSTNIILEQQKNDVGSASSVMNMSFNLFGCVGMLLASAPFTNKAIALGAMVAICLALAALGWWSLNRSGNEIKGLYR